MAKSESRSSAMSGFWATLVTLAVLVLAVVPPILLRGWLNWIPHLWDVYFPLLTLFAAYLLVRAIRSHEGWISVATWGLLCAGAACAAAFHLLEAPRIFFSIGQGLCIAFVVAQALQVLAEGLTDNAGHA